MKSILTIILVFMCLPLFSQSGIEIKSPFTSEGICECPCGRPWMSSETEMDTLKNEIWQFDKKIRQEVKDSLIDYSVTYIKIYETEYIHRIEFDGRVNEQFCVKRDSLEKQLDESTALTGMIESFSGKFLIKTAGYYYLGNAEIRSYLTEYFMKKEQ